MAVKALIVERRGQDAAVLREDGVILRARVAGGVGQEIEVEGEVLRFPSRRSRWLRSAVAAALAVAILGGSYTYTNVSACAYVSLDVGDSAVELSVNRLGRVIAVRPVSEADRVLARSLETALRGRPVEDALADTVTRLRAEGYFAAESDVLIAGVTSDSERRGEALTAALESAAGQEGAVPLRTMEVSPAERDQARANAQSGGRFVYERDAETPTPPEETPVRASAPSPAPTETVTPTETPSPAPTETVTPTETPSPVPAEAPPERSAEAAVPDRPPETAQEFTPPQREEVLPTAAPERTEEPAAEMPPEIPDRELTQTPEPPQPDAPQPAEPAYDGRETPPEAVPQQPAEPVGGSLAGPVVPESAPASGPDGGQPETPRQDSPQSQTLDEGQQLPGAPRSVGGTVPTGPADARAVPEGGQTPRRDLPQGGATPGAPQSDAPMGGGQPPMEGPGGGR